MRDKKTTQINVRISPEFKEKADGVALQYGLGLGTLAHMLLKNFIAAAEEHGNELIWPPQFNHHLNAQTYLDAIRTADEERLQLVAETGRGYKTTPIKDAPPDQDQQADGESRTSAS